MAVLAAPAPVALITAVLVLLAAGHAAPLADGGWTSRFDGWWDEGGDPAELCAAGRILHRKTWAPNRRRLTYTYERPKRIYGGHDVETLHYEVLRADPDVLTLFLEGETRRLPTGELIVWQLVFLEPRAYRWRVATHPPGQFSRVWGVRCER